MRRFNNHRSLPMRIRIRIEINVTREGRTSVVCKHNDGGVRHWHSGRCHVSAYHEMPSSETCWSIKQLEDCFLIWIFGYQMGSGGWVVTSPRENGSEIWPRENPRRLTNVSKLNYKGTKDLVMRRKARITPNLALLGLLSVPGGGFIAKRVHRYHEE